ncbi:hypothetical protein [Ketobacter sp.]|uniref:hypothetical protein n=1 Tax=Ketobacter sp. TaxID=2083498 RepID=UPI000F11B306|nr:hypothetical protein [Ketobacter sp.]RLU01132.1 MAG: hypothetical protein D9N14_04075 [Ketobacter sp.]
MNIWAMDKDISIKHVLLLLHSHLGADTFLVDQNVHANAKGIYLEHPSEPGVRAYLFTTGQEPERYGLHLEYPDAALNNNLIDAYENLKLISLLNILAVHFDVSELKNLDLLG